MMRPFAACGGLWQQAGSRVLGCFGFSGCLKMFFFGFFEAWFYVSQFLFESPVGGLVGFLHGADFGGGLVQGSVGCADKRLVWNVL